MSKCSNVRSEDIPLRKAVVAMRGVMIDWHPKAVKVFAFPLPAFAVRYYECDFGIGNAEFACATRKERLRQLFELKRELVDVHSFREKQVDDAFSVIPAFRRALKRSKKAS
jgi:hypothetical protein